MARELEGLFMVSVIHRGRLFMVSAISGVNLKLLGLTTLQWFGGTNDRIRNRPLIAGNVCDRRSVGGENFDIVGQSIDGCGAIRNHHVATFTLHFCYCSETLILGFECKTDNPLSRSLVWSRAMSGVSINSSRSGSPDLAIFSELTRWGI